MAIAIVAFAGPVGTGAGFQDDDGNLIDDGAGIDWNSFSPTTWTGSAPFRQSTKSALGWQFLGLEDAAETTSDSAFAGGTKQDDDCPTVTGAKAPNKDDLKRIYLASTTGANGHTYLMLSWVRIPQNTVSPSAHIGFEFNKGNSGACPATSDGLVKRTAGDMLIVYDFEGGAGDLPVLTLRRWVTSGACEVGSKSPPCWGTATNLTAGGFAEGRVNTFGSVSDTIGPSSPTSETLGTNEFGEAGIDLTAAGVFPEGACNSFGKAFGVSRSSGNSGTAQMKDLVGPGNFNLTNCGTVIIKKRTTPRGLNQEFGFTSTLAGSELSCTQPAPETATSFSLNDNGNSSSDSAANTQTCTNVPAGSYTVTEGADPAGFVFTDLSCTATGTGTSATPASGDATKTASITMAGGGSVTCVYTNTQQLGAIEITKTRKHAATPSNTAHAGVTFIVKQGAPPGGTTVATVQTGTDGTVCVPGLAFGTYTVTETVPAGYSVDANNKSVTVNNNANCSNDPDGEEVSFHNTPLTNLTVTVNSQVDGGTGSTINCVDGATPPNPVASANVSPLAPPDGTNGDGSATANDLVPGTYTCTVVIDP